MGIISARPARDGGSTTVSSDPGPEARAEHDGETARQGHAYR
jgi:hypothetical protein